MLITIGQLFENAPSPRPALGHHIIMTPENFLVPIGLNRDSALFLLAAFEANVSSNAVRSLANKRQRVQQPVTYRTSFTNPGESNFAEPFDACWLMIVQHCSKR
jgi:hypothetical protein